MARILGRKGRNSNGAPINNLDIGDRTSLQDFHEGISTSTPKTDWTNIQPERVWYNTGQVGELYGKWVTKPLDNWMLDPDGIATGVLNKGWRSMILINRGIGRPNDDALKKRKYDPAKSSKRVDKKRQDRESEVIQGKQVIVDSNTYRLTGQSTHNGQIFRFIGSAIEPDQLPYKDNQTHTQTLNWLREHNNQIIIYNTSATPYEYIVLQNRPTQADFKGETSWATIKSMGRNTPIYQYTGAEDTLQFNISWFCTNRDNPDEVINKCRLLESWSKSDGYKAAPPILNIQWGNNVEDHMLVNHDYILISATYTLRNFNNGAREVVTTGIGRMDFKLWPAVATQELIFKRVSSGNLTYEDILPSVKKETVIKKKTN